MILKMIYIYALTAVFASSYLCASSPQQPNQIVEAQESPLPEATPSEAHIEKQTDTQADAEITAETPTETEENGDRIPAATGKPLLNRKHSQTTKSSSQAGSAKRVPSANPSPFQYCPDLRSMATEILEYESRGFAYPWSVPACHDRSIFKAFNPGFEDGGDGPVVSPDIIVADSAKPYEIIAVQKVAPERYRADFYVFTRNSSGKVMRSKGSLGFIVADGPQAKDPEVGCVVYTDPPKKQFVRQDCIDLKRSSDQHGK